MAPALSPGRRGATVSWRRPFSGAPNREAVLVGLATFGVRLLLAVQSGAMTRVLGYDEGVYYSAAAALDFGRLPYRDVLLLHPPGILLALAPFVEVGRLTTDRTGFVVARVAFLAVGALNAALVYRIARHLGRLAALAAGGFAALWPAAVAAERSTVLESLANLGVLTSLLLLSCAPAGPRRRVLGAGVAVGLAMTVKVWAVLPAVVLLGWLVRTSGRAGARRYLAGAAAAVVAVCTPFFLAAPWAMIRMVVLDQLRRPGTGIDTLHRLAAITGGDVLAKALSVSTLTATAGLSAAVLACVGLAVARPGPARLWATLLAGNVALLLTSPSFFGRYPLFATPFLALVVGAAADQATPVLRRIHAAAAPALVAVAVVALAAGLLVGGYRVGKAFPGERVEAALHDRRCVVADAATALVLSDTLTPVLRRGCPLVADLTGITYDQDPNGLVSGNPARARRTEAWWQRRVTRYFRSADAVVITRPGPGGLTAATLRSARRGRAVVRVGRYVVLRAPRPAAQVGSGPGAASAR